MVSQFVEAARELDHRIKHDNLDGAVEALPYPFKARVSWRPACNSVDLFVTG